jgi:hypothetical protein
MDMDESHEADGSGQQVRFGANPREKQDNLGPTGGSGGAVSNANIMSTRGGLPASKVLPVFIIHAPPGLSLEGSRLGVESEPVDQGGELQPTYQASPSFKKEQLESN